MLVNQANDSIKQFVVKLSKYYQSGLAETLSASMFKKRSNENHRTIVPVKFNSRG